MTLLCLFFWAIVFAILFYRRYELISERMPNKPNLAAALTLIFIIVIVIIPFLLVGFMVIDEAGDIYQKFNESDISIEQQVEDLQEIIPVDNSFFQKYGLNVEEIKRRVSEIVANGTQIIAGRLVSITQNIFGFLINFSMMIYILFFFLRDGKRLVQELVWVLPIGDEKEWTLLKRFERVTRATVKGSLVVAIAQGTLGGILFYFVGIPAAFLWGVIMTIASLLPVGSALIWGPWAAVFLYQGETAKGIILLIVGAGFIGLIDNLLRPRLVGQDTKLPDYLVLLSTLGGLTWFGISGFVIGPIIAALFVTSWQMLGIEYGKPYEEVVTESTSEDNDG